MRFYFDTEFTQFRDGELLSIALVTDEDHELVVEVHDRGRLARASEFCRSTVIPQFGCTPAWTATTDAEVGKIVAHWLAQFEAPHTMLYDYKLDWRHLEHLLRAAGEWSRLGSTLKPFNVADVANDDRCLAAQDAYFQGLAMPGRHHPLVDARAMRARWQTYLRLNPAV
ncbi:MAG TPA: hypothetical protein VJM48_07315 [Methylibium sp.]|nr:hypothetical protein [Methylibium sp.]